jgi:hypothetical protein
MKHSELLSSVRDLPTEAGLLFKLLRSVAYFQSSPEKSRRDGLDLLVRIVDKRDAIEKILPGSSAMLDAMIRDAGLYPYIKQSRSWQDSIALDLVTAPGESNVHFHIEQAKVFSMLRAGKSLILSAPTSFGKSLLIDALISSNQPFTVVACVPTIALLDEFRRRMRSKFPQYQIITSAGQERDADVSAIFIGTQERLRERDDIRDVDLFVLDEFYKLDLSRGDDRALSLNALLGTTGRNAKQVYLLGPSIDEVPNRQGFRHDIEFYKTDYSPVTADVIDRSKLGASPESLIGDLNLEADTSSLIYVKSPPSSSRLAFQLIKEGRFKGTNEMDELGSWLASNYHSEWALVRSLPSGIGIHHGRVPRSIAHLMVSAFNRGELKRLVCTSSMIEGVNTAAECVFIYDRKISTKKLDRFTFDNIKGRAGRLNKHAVGRIYLYDSPPEVMPSLVEVPLFGAQSSYSDELLLQMDENFLSERSRKRKEQINRSSSLPLDILKRWSEFGVDALNNLADEYQNLDGRGTDVVWRGFPDFETLEATFELAWAHLRFEKHGLRSARQAAHFCSVLYRVRGQMAPFLNRLVKGRDLDAQTDIDLCFGFLRAAEYTLPQVLRAMHDVANATLLIDSLDYTAYAVALQNWFLPHGIRGLEELGVPTPIGLRILPEGMPIDEDPEQLVARLPDLAASILSAEERKILELGIW